MKNKNRWLGTAVVTIGLAGALFFPVTGAVPSESGASKRSEAMDLSTFSDAKPQGPLRLLFIHHSIGGTLLAAPGPEEEIERCIYRSHPFGGDARRLLEEQGYEVHEASYKSDLGDRTDLFDWVPKFRAKANKILSCDQNDKLYGDGKKNQIVVIKSCYPNSRFVGEGTEPGNPAGPELTIANAKAALGALLEEFKKHPDTLFVYTTAPPLAPKTPKQPMWKWAVKKAMGKPDPAEVLATQGRLARAFNNWVRGKDGWLANYPLKNVVVFDYFDILTDEGTSNLSRYASEGGTDSHPTREGNQKAAAKMVSLMNRAVRRAGLTQ